MVYIVAEYSLHNCYNYFSNKAAFEFNPSLPYFLLNNLSAMQEAPSKLLRKHSNATCMVQERHL